MIDFAPAVRTNTAIVLALAGSSGSGKTKSALELSVGLAGERGKTLVIDTEGRRALHYADDYRFFHHEWRPPFTPQALGELLKEAERREFAVVIVDSMSDEHEGEGGLCDMAEAEYQAQGANKNSAAAWAKPKAAHKHQIVRWLRQASCHVIFCLRADEKVEFQKVERNGRQTTVVVPRGWIPIAEKRLLYDVTTSLLFTPDRAGVPTAITLYDNHKPSFRAERRASRAAGHALAEWAAGGRDGTTAPAHPASAPRRGPLGENETQAELEFRAEGAAKFGVDFFRTFWRQLKKPERDSLRGFLARYQAIARDADATGESASDAAAGVEASAGLPVAAGEQP
jgi:hypothetical protein